MSNNNNKVILSKDVAISEFMDRNGVFCNRRKDVVYQQPLHYELLNRVVGPTKLRTILDQNSEGNNINNDKGRERKKKIYLHRVDLEFMGDDVAMDDSPIGDDDNIKKKSIIIIGGGIMGSSIALSLMLQHNNNNNNNNNLTVTVLDPDDSGLGQTTAASWAWLNANSKSPNSYKSLNQLGMRAWRKENSIIELKQLPVWNGSLVCFSEPLSNDNDNKNIGYNYEGPLSQERIKELEPEANFPTTTDAYTYYFPDEGYVDPSQAVRILKEEASNLGVEFQKERVIGMLYHNNNNSSSSNNDDDNNDEERIIIGVKSSPSSSSSTSTSTSQMKNDDTTIVIKERKADIIIVAAGIGSADKVLGECKLPLFIDNPGCISFAKQNNNSNNPSAKSSNNDEEEDGDRAGTTTTTLNRLLVDTINESHVLQRKDGYIVAGGGYLQSGGTTFRKEEEEETDTTTSSSNINENNNNDTRISEKNILEEEVQQKQQQQQQQQHDQRGKELIFMASKLIPNILQRSTYEYSKSAIRPMPFDGLPIIGFFNNNSNKEEDDTTTTITTKNKNKSSLLYAAVTHSGITLSLLLGQLIAVEILEQVSLDILRPYRIYNNNTRGEEVVE